MKPNLLPISAAAEEKGCTPQALRNAVKRGDLNEMRAGRYSLIALDEKWNTYVVQETGGRLHTNYRDHAQGDGA